MLPLPGDFGRSHLGIAAKVAQLEGILRRLEEEDLRVAVRIVMNALGSIYFCDEEEHVCVFSDNIGLDLFFLISTFLRRLFVVLVGGVWEDAGDCDRHRN